MTYDAIIIGGGAAGLFCASQLGQRGKRVLVLEHADKIGKKILISGGGRCNFTNLYTSPQNFISQNPHFVKSALARFDQHDFIALVDRHHIPHHEKTLGQIFCDGSAREIVAMLQRECNKSGVEIQIGTSVKRIEYRDSLYHINQFQSRTLIIATGGPSIPKMGASGFAYEIAKQFGVPIVDPRPGLVPFTLPETQKLFTSLSGIATPSRVYNNRASFEEATLFTHKGLSGPAILQISSYWELGEEFRVDLTPNQQTGWLSSIKKDNPKWHLKRALAQLLPERLAIAIAERIGLATSLAETRTDKLTEIETQLREWSFTPNGTEGYAKAEVTIGGIDTRALNSKTMAVKAQPTLFFIGEAVDVTGWLGGYNFQWAWSSGFAAAEALT